MRHIIIALGCLFFFSNSGMTQQWNTVYPFSEYNQYTDVWMSGDGDGFLAGKNGRIIKTTDNGLSWEQITSAGSEHLIGVHYFESSNQLLTFSNSDIYISNDEGISWTNPSEGIVTEDIKYHCIEDNIAFLYSNEDVHTSIDAGNNWTKSNSVWGDELIADIKIINDDLSYLMTKSGILFKSIDLGITWQEVSEFNFSGPVAKFDFIDSDIGLAFIQGNKLYKTTDGGIVWESVIFSGSIGFSGAVFEMKNENEVYVLANGTSMSKSEDGGMSWNSAEITQYGYERYTNLHSDSQGVFWSVGEYQILGKSTDQGATWTDIFEADKGPLLHVSNFNTDQLITGGTNRKLYISKDGGASWESTGENGYHKNDLAVSPNGDLFHTWGYSGLWRSTDNGVSWFEFYDPAGFVASIDINSEGDILLSSAVAGNNFHLSTDNGATWNITPTPDDIRPEDVKFLTKSRAIAWEGGVLVESIDGGVSWELADLGISGKINNVKKTNDESIWVITSARGYRSTDQGDTWEKVSLPNSSAQDIAFLDDQIGWLISEENAQGNIHFTEDGGETWTLVDQSDFRFNAITITNSVIPQIIAVGHGGIIKRLVFDINSSTTYSKIETLNVFPNPGSDHLILDDIPTEGRIAIYNSQGQKVYYLEYSERESMTIATNNFANGMYFISVVSQDSFYQGSWLKLE